MPDESMENAEKDHDPRQVEINKKLEEMAKADPSFKDLLESAPEEAFQKAGVVDQFQALQTESAEAAGEEVAAHAWWNRTYYRSCYWRQQGYLWHQR